MNKNKKDQNVYCSACGKWIMKAEPCEHMEIKCHGCKRTVHVTVRQKNISVFAEEKIEDNKTSVTR